MEGRLARKDPRLAVPAGWQFQSRSGPHCHVQDTPGKADVTAMAEKVFEELAAPVPRCARLKILGERPGHGRQRNRVAGGADSTDRECGPRILARI